MWFFANFWIETLYFYRISLRRFCTISTAKTIRVATTKLQNKSIGSMGPPIKKTGGSFVQRKKPRPVLMDGKG
jgi:hypothetical protein